MVSAQRSLDTEALSFADNLQMGGVAATSSLIVVVRTYHGVSLLRVSSAVGGMNMWGTWRVFPNTGDTENRLWAFLLSADAARVSSEIVTLWVGWIRGVFMEFGSQAWFAPFTLQQI